MASPLSKNLIAGAIGESGSPMGTLTPVPLAEAEQVGVRFANKLGAKSLAELRKIPAKQLLEATAEAGFGRFPLAVDGYFLVKNPVDIFAAGEQSRVPLLVGWNSEESNYRADPRSRASRRVRTMPRPCTSCTATMPRRS